MVRTVNDLRTPCLVLRRSVLQQNARNMIQSAASLGCRLRPHFKTTKTIGGALLATGGVKQGLVCSTLAEVSFLAQNGFDDLLYAVPLSSSKWAEVLDLHTKLASFHVMVDQHDQLDALEERVRATGPPPKPVSVFVAVDCGYHREGVDPNDPSSVALVKRLVDSSNFCFAGLYSHAGQSYAASTPEDVRAIATIERDMTVSFATKLRSEGIQVACVGVGSTPTCSLPPAHMIGVDEIHPGNYLYYDTTQMGLGACTEAQIAPRVLTRVLGHYRQSNTLLIDCGWTAASAQGKEHGYGSIAGHPELRIEVLKQECGEVTASDGKPLEFSKYPIGSILSIMPYHSCASTQQHREIHVLDDDEVTVLDSWLICKGW